MLMLSPVFARATVTRIVLSTDVTTCAIKTNGKTTFNIYNKCTRRHSLLKIPSDPMDPALGLVASHAARRSFAASTYPQPLCQSPVPDQAAEIIFSRIAGKSRGGSTPVPHKAWTVPVARRRDTIMACGHSSPRSNTLTRGVQML